MLSYLPYVFSQMIQPMTLALMIAGTAIGIIFGAIPGLSGTMAVMLLAVACCRKNFMKASPPSPRPPREL